MTDDLEIAEKHGLDYYPKRSKTHYRDLKIVQDELKKQLKDKHIK